MPESRSGDDQASVKTGIEINGPAVPGLADILTDEACAFVAMLERQFGDERRRLLEARAAFQARIDAGENPAFRPDTKAIREGDWTIAGTPADLTDRRVEITGPVDRKMIINALNCGASCFMADFEDAASPTWEAMIAGQVNLRDAARRTIAMTDPNSGKSYALGDEIATLIVRPRGWHLEEAHLLVDGRPVSASLFDFGFYFFHNAAELRANGSGPYFYLPKMEHYEEAALWNAVFVAAQEELGLPIGTIKATVLIETITAAFEMDEILHALKDHIVGLNCGRWDYIFSVIKTFRNRPDWVLPDRGLVTMTQPFMRAYSRLLIKTCHRRGAHAMGGMAAQIPIKGDDAANEEAFGKVRADKEREAGDGHDGTWVAHPGLVPVAREVFDRLMPEANQVSRQLGNVTVTEADLLAGPRRRAHRGGAAQQHPRRHPVHRGVARGPRRRAPLQPDGRRGHRRDQPRPALAMPAPRRAHGGRPHGRLGVRGPVGRGRGRGPQRGSRRGQVGGRPLRRGGCPLHPGRDGKRLPRLPDASCVQGVEHHP